MLANSSTRAFVEAELVVWLWWFGAGDRGRLAGEKTGRQCRRGAAQRRAVMMCAEAPALRFLSI